MQKNIKIEAIIIALGLVIGLWLLGSSLYSGITDFKKLERSITVKGLSEREYPADTVIWPLQFSVSSNALNDLYQQLDKNAEIINRFMQQQGINSSEITLSAPQITDKSVHQYGDQRPTFRFLASQTVTVYANDVDRVRKAMKHVSSLGKQGIVLQGENYGSQTQYLFTRLNAVKPEMIEEATNKAREVAQKFAKDSKSKLGKIKKARQGQFSISNRDQNSPHLKKVRVVSTVEYYLTD